MTRRTSSPAVAPVTAAEDNRYVVAFGSNIEPAVHLPAALEALRDKVDVEAVSEIYETEPQGSQGSPLFWNAAARVRSPLPPSRLKAEILRPVEAGLGRVRSSDRNAPRTIDLDLVLSFEGTFEDEEDRVSLPDPNLMRFAHLVVPVSEVAPSWAAADGEPTLETAASAFERDVTKVEAAGWGPRAGLDVERISRRLDEIRARTRELVEGLAEETLRKQHIPILSPMIWDLGHIANFEELWLVRKLVGEGPLEPDLDELYDAVKNPRPVRESLPVPSGQELLDYLDSVRGKTLEIAEQMARRSAEGALPLLREGFVYEMVAVHEEQHQETLLQALQVLEDPPYEPPQRRELPREPHAEPEMVEIPAGGFQMGAAPSGFAYDNERPRHSVELDAYWIDRYPTTAGQYEGFVSAGGYDREELWSEPGWAWRCETGARAPVNWVGSADGGWRVRFMDRVSPLDRSKPVVHVCYYEAEAFACWAGKRLPTEPEWEKAALWDPAPGAPRRYPWGDRPPSGREANLDQTAFEPAAIGSYPGAASAFGVEQLIGDVWEWTSSDFASYPGFEAFPYAEYSEIFFGPDYKVLRGGSWATRPEVARGTFRNWDLPIRRQIFAGFRCARDG